MSDPRLFWFREHQPIYKAVVPGTEEIAQGGSTEQTFAAWEKRCAAIGLEFANPIAEFQHRACMALPEPQRASMCSWVSDTSPAVVRQTRLIRLDDVENFFKSAWRWWRSEDVVLQDEANRRAAICACCPKNVRAMIGGCTACNGVMQKITNRMHDFIGNRTTTSDARLNHCEVCGCSLRIIVHAPLAALNAHEPHQFPSYCWQRAS